MTAPTDFGIGTTSSTTALKSLSTPVPNPKATHAFYAEQKTMASGKVVGVGLPVIIWDWGYLTVEQRDMLRSYCTGASATVFIDSQGNDSDDTFVSYQAIMKWPLVETRDATRRVPFRLEFIHCQEIATLP